MKKMLIFLLLMATPAVFASESLVLAPLSFQVSARDALFKFEQTVLYPESLLKRFTPVGAKISNKRITQNAISFVATKTILFIQKSVHVNVVLESTVDNRGCPKEDVGYSLKMRFDSSDDLVTDNVEELQAIICLRAQSDAKLVGNVQSKIIIGNNYSKVVGPIAVNLIKEQLSPLLNALVEEVRTLK